MCNFKKRKKSMLIFFLIIILENCLTTGRINANIKAT